MEKPLVGYDLGTAIARREFREGRTEPLAPVAKFMTDEERAGYLEAWRALGWNMGT